MNTARCPACNALLGVPTGFRRGRCPDCGALVGHAAAVSQHNPAPRPARGSGRTGVGVDRALRAFERFHGVEPETIHQVQVPDFPKVWWKIGDAAGAAIEYVPPAYSERSPDTYRHEWGDLGSRKQRSRAKVLVSEDGRWLLIPPANFRVTERGIVG